MKKKIEFISGGHPANIGEMLISRIIPNNKVQAVGPFVFLDYVSPIHYKARTPQMPDGRGAHPQRGIATLLICCMENLSISTAGGIMAL